MLPGIFQQVKPPKKNWKLFGQTIGFPLVFMARYEEHGKSQFVFFLISRKIHENFKSASDQGTA